MPMDLASERNRMVIELAKQRRSLREIGNRLGVTRARAHQIVQRIKADAPDILVQDSPLYTIAEVVDLLGEDAPSNAMHQIRELCHAETIPVERISSSPTAPYLFTPASVEAIKIAIERATKHACAWCRKTFAITRWYAKRKSGCCSDRCRKALKASVRYDIAKGRPQKFRRELLKKIRAHTLPKDETWLLPAPASRRAHITEMQLYLLKQTSSVTVRPHPTPRHRGNRVMTFAASEMDIVRKVYAKRKKTNSSIPSNELNT